MMERSSGQQKGNLDQLKRQRSRENNGLDAESRVEPGRAGTTRDREEATHDSSRMLAA
jgi:hypothetical protein